MDIVDQIELLTARTLAGLNVKARAVSWCQGDGKIELNGTTTDVRIMTTIMADLLAMPSGGVQS